MGSRAIGIMTSVLAAALVLAGCTSTDASPGSSPGPASTTPSQTATTPSPGLPTVDSYAALGDSFTAGPGLADLRDGAGLCLRSTHNWPTLLGRALHAKTFVDVSCIGASTRDLLHNRTIPGGVVPAQIDAVNHDTDLVTVGIGGNDENLFTSLVGACTHKPAACSSFVGQTVPAILDRTGPRLVKALRTIRDRAPGARVMLVGYLSILPETGGCDLIPIPRSELAKGVSAERALDLTLAKAAKTADVTYVSMRAVSRGHDACAGAQAWTNGDVVRDDDGVAFHPRLAGMKAIERAVAAELAGQDRS